MDNGQHDFVTDTDTISGSCVIIRNDVFKSVGFLDKSLFLYWEDSDLSQRVKRKGLQIRYAPIISVRHKVSASAGGIGSKSNDYFLIRNRYYFAMRYARLRTKFAIFRDTIRLLFFGQGWQRLGARDALIGIKGAGPWIKK